MTKKAKEPKKPKNPVGRPCTYKPEYAEQARKLCLLHHGTTNKDLAKFFEKNEDTIYEWQNKFPEFSEAIRAGKKVADTEVAGGLYQRAIGAVWHEETAFKLKEVYYDEFGKKVKEVERIEVVQLQRAAPPDTPAASLWLRNRDPANWREKPETPDDDDVQPVKVEINVTDARKPESADA